MPRKRKRSTIHNKAPLIFTESPVNKQTNPPTPVYCAEHPQTAVSIPVEDCSNTSWVSPQFNQVALSAKGKTRGSRRKTNSLSMDPNTGKGCTCSASNKENAVNNNLKRNKYKPLKFKGEHTLPQTIIEDVNITTDEEDNECSMNLSTNRKKSPVLERKISKRKSKFSVQGESSNSKKVQRRSCLSSPEQFEGGHVSVCTPVGVYQNDSVSVQYPLTRGTTPLAKGNNSPVKVLFPNSSHDRIHSDGYEDGYAVINSQTLHIKQINPKSLIIKNLGLNSTFSQSPVTDRNGPKILVADTPEADYNVPVKLRRLRNRLVKL